MRMTSLMVGCVVCDVEFRALWILFLVGLLSQTLSSMVLLHIAGMSTPISQQSIASVNESEFQHEQNEEVEVELGEPDLKRVGKRFQKFGMSLRAEHGNMKSKNEKEEDALWIKIPESN
ncbi:hypothetical protein J5N97_017660 [Dioscorea zingiberensis]|uniref:Uncharacterized protein n=1 Tax=Dioscorea zingiberensis TaxID=325984 RepID=A0A9D5CM21_9LILI|nr:hypothetical protein J5N97_017660 [Dioscorea zingiberensis]